MCTTDLTADMTEDMTVDMTVDMNEDMTEDMTADMQWCKPNSSVLQLLYIVSVLWQEEGYMEKYSLSPGQIPRDFQSA